MLFDFSDNFESHHPLKFLKILGIFRGNTWNFAVAEPFFTSLLHNVFINSVFSVVSWMTWVKLWLRSCGSHGPSKFWRGLNKMAVFKFCWGWNRSSHRRFSVKRGVQLCNFIKKRLQHRYYAVKFVKFLKTLILKNICEQLLLVKHDCMNFYHDYIKFYLWF